MDLRRDIVKSVQISRSQAESGSAIPVTSDGGRQIQVQIPRGVKPGTSVLVKGMGRQINGISGDLYVVIVILEDQDMIPLESKVVSVPRSRYKPKPAISVTAPIGAIRTGSEKSLSIESAKKDLDALVGLASVKEQIFRFEALLAIQIQRRLAGMEVKPQTLHFVFTGNPGTGKTTVARIIGKFLYGYSILTRGHVVETDRVGLVAEFLGQTSVKTEKKIQEAMDGVLFIDEAYSLSRKGAGNLPDTYGMEVIDLLLKRMEDCRERLVVIVAGYPTEMQEFIESNPGLKSRFTRYIGFPDYSTSELLEITRRFISEGGYILSPAAEESVGCLFDAMPRGNRFGNARDARNLVDEIISRQALRLTRRGGNHSRDDLGLISSDDIPWAP